MAASLDVNILLYAVNRADPRHGVAAGFLEERLLDHETLYLAWPTLMAFLRIATHPGIFSKPLTQAQAQGGVLALLSRPNVETVAEREGFWQAYLDVSAEAAPVTGKLVPDAHLATILKQHGIKTLFTFDRDFRRFGFLDVRVPGRA